MNPVSTVLSLTRRPFSFGESIALFMTMVLIGAVLSFFSIYLNSWTPSGANVFTQIEEQHVKFTVNGSSAVFKLSDLEEIEKVGIYRAELFEL